MELTLSVDEDIVERATKAAQSMGKSLDQAVRDYLDGLAHEEKGRGSFDLELKRTAGTGKITDWKFDREEAHGRT